MCITCVLSIVLRYLDKIMLLQIISHYLWLHPLPEENAMCRKSHPSEDGFFIYRDSFTILSDNKDMKKQLALYVVVFALAFGIASPASAQHCDVKKGDSIYRIADRYHIVFKTLLKYNKHLKNPDLIYPGDEIEIPDSSDGSNTPNGSENDNIQGGNDTITGQGESTQANQVLKLVNAERSKAGVKPLTLSSTLTSIANVKAKDMAVHKYFSHNSPTYGTPFQMLQKFGVKYKTAGENIAGGQKTAQQVMNSWMNSSGHKANILNKDYTELGVGFYAGGLYDTYWVQLFIGK